MSGCSEIRKLFLVAPESVTPEESRRILRHLEECPDCRDLQEDLLLLDQASAEIGVPDPGEEYWDNFALRVRQKISATRERERSRVIKWFISRPAFSWPTAAAAMVVVFFVTWTMMRDGSVPGPTQIAQTDLQMTAEQGDVGPQMDRQTPGEKAESIETRSEPGELAQRGEEAISPAGTSSPIELPVPAVAANELPPQPTSERPEGKAPSYDPGEIPSEELQSVLAARERNLTQADLPERKTIILRGDTTQAELSDRDLPDGRDLELAERPNAPFPTDDTGGGAAAERGLASPMAEDYTGYDRSYPALNKDDFTADDREFFTQRITELTEDLAQKVSAGKRRKLCRQLVDMYYQLAINWKVEEDITAAQEYIKEAREILREEDYADLDAKAGALKSLLDK